MPGTPTELGARVPGIMWGADVKRGVVSRAVADLTDIFATLADLSGATLPKDRVLDGKSFAPVLRGEKPRHREWIYSHLDDGRVLRDERWLLEIPFGNKGGRLFDCGTSRDGTSYRDVTDSNEPEAKAARARFAAVLAKMPKPKPRTLLPEETKGKKQ
jgi:arylsulfatase A